MTPMMEQYFEIKSRYPGGDTILFFRLGDFYEMFFEDAEVASKILDIALTSRNKNDENPVPLCGIPFHSADGYISKLLNSGKKVAICEQIEDPSEAKGIVRRDVIRVITPGTVTGADSLKSDRHNFLAAVGLLKNKWGFAYIDVTTGLFRATEFASQKEVADEIARIEPSEVLVARSLFEQNILQPEEGMLRGISFTLQDDPKFDPLLLEGRVSKTCIDALPLSSRGPAGAIINYAGYAAKEALNLIKNIEAYKPSCGMIIDESTKRNLELVRTMIDGSHKGSLLWLIDQTLTPMGGRKIRDWLLSPLTNVEEIRSRQNGVERFWGDSILSSDVGNVLSEISDIERLAGRIAMESANARDLINLKQSLNSVPKLYGYVISRHPQKFCHPRESGDPTYSREIPAPCLPRAGASFAGMTITTSSLADVARLIDAYIADDAPVGLKDGGFIKSGASKELDELRSISREGKGFIAGLEAEEKKRTGISSLKVRYNRVFGYYIEVTNTHKDRVPADYIRKQTLANAERYITPELKNYEEKVLGAEERIKALEYEIFAELRKRLGANVDEIKSVAEDIAVIDVLLSLANVARENRYVKPEIDSSSGIEIKDGRHPIIEKINASERFIPNDLSLNAADKRMMIITGPNMAGKSTVMRQAAIIVLMAQIGSYVPAGSAKIGIVDRIFTRVGASDNIMRGQSTFMVEMSEAANILKDATERSLIIIDEIGRGTSTFDGLAIAWAVAEHIHDNVRAKTLFATHYHELTDLEKTKKSAKNFNIAVKEWNNKIIFLHKLVPGGVNHSYGIQVAELAGLPKDVVERAREILANLETGELDEVGMPRLAYSKNIGAENQLHLFHADPSGELIKKIKETDTDVMSPIEALNFLHKIKGQI